jgi:hypothetical protein
MARWNHGSSARKLLAGRRNGATSPDNLNVGAVRTEERDMNTYDPMNCIVYRHMVPKTEPFSVPLASGGACSQLPPEYAN